jgi:hypothetical protein
MPDDSGLQMRNRERPKKSDGESALKEEPRLFLA